MIRMISIIRMYVCMYDLHGLYVCMYVCMYACMHVRMGQACTHTHICMYMSYAYMQWGTGNSSALRPEPKAWLSPIGNWSNLQPRRYVLVEQLYWSQSKSNTYSWKLMDIVQLYGKKHVHTWHIRTCYLYGVSTMVNYVWNGQFCMNENLLMLHNLLPKLYEQQIRPKLDAKLS